MRKPREEWSPLVLYPATRCCSVRTCPWDALHLFRRDPEDGRIYVAKDTGGAGMCYLTPPDSGQTWGSRFCDWRHPGWLSPKEFEALPVLTPRAASVYALYFLRKDGDQWVATALWSNGNVMEQAWGLEKAAVCREARARWGHFNHADEAQAFAEIFRA